MRNIISPISQPVNPPTNKGGISAAATEQAEIPTVYVLKDYTPSPNQKSPLAICHTVRPNKINNLGRTIRVYNNLLEVPESEMLSRNRRLKIQTNSPKSKRGKITKRSQKSRVNQLKHIYKLPVMPEMFSLFTWADDVSGYLDQAEKKDLMNDHKRQLNRWMSKVLEGTDWFFNWSQEWKKRLSGKETKDQNTPHLHALWRVNGMNEVDYHNFSIKMNLKWIEITGTKNYLDASRVAGHNKNNQYLGNSPKKAVSYCVKYSTGQDSDEGEAGQSIGRTWGMWGTIKQAAAEEIKMDESSIIKLKRLLRKKAKKARGWYLSSLKIMSMGTMAFIWGTELIRYVEWLNLTNHAPGVPF